MKGRARKPSLFKREENSREGESTPWHHSENHPGNGTWMGFRFSDGFSRSGLPCRERYCQRQVQFFPATIREHSIKERLFPAASKDHSGKRMILAAIREESTERSSWEHSGNFRRGKGGALPGSSPKSIWAFWEELFRHHSEINRR